MAAHQGARERTPSAAWLSSGFRQKLFVSEDSGSLLGVRECWCGYCRDHTCGSTWAARVDAHGAGRTPCAPLRTAQPTPHAPHPAPTPHARRARPRLYRPRPAHRVRVLAQAHLTLAAVDGGGHRATEALALRTPALRREATIDGRPRRWRDRWRSGRCRWPCRDRWRRRRRRRVWRSEADGRALRVVDRATRRVLCAVQGVAGSTGGSVLGVVQGVAGNTRGCVRQRVEDGGAGGGGGQ